VISYLGPAAPTRSKSSGRLSLLSHVEGRGRAQKVIPLRFRYKLLFVRNDVPRKTSFRDTDTPVDAAAMRLPNLILLYQRVIDFLKKKISFQRIFADAKGNGVM